MKKNIYLQLFSSTFYLSTFTIGGGYVIVPLMKKRFVDQLQWIEEDEMLNLIAIAQSSPGAIAINASILIGYRVAGFLGSLVTILGSIIPPLIMLSVISVYYSAFRDNQVVSAVLKGMQAGVTAIIADVVIGLGGPIFKEKQFLSIAILLGAFIATFFLNINVIYIILACGIIGALRAMFFFKRSDK